MPRLSKTILLSILAFTFITLLSCDKYNIVEPRFYDVTDIEEIYSENDTVLFQFALPSASNVVCYLIGSAGNIIQVFYLGPTAAGYHYVNWNWRDSDGNKYPEGLYCFILITSYGEYRHCFEHHDPEEYLP